MISRRLVVLVALIALSGLGCSPAGSQDGAWIPTPSTGRGPFNPSDTSGPTDNDLTEVPGATGAPRGEIVYMEGVIFDIGGRPLKGAEMTVWQTDAQGLYDHPGHSRHDAAGEPMVKDLNFQYWGRITTDADGRYEFKTVRPGAYPASGTWRPSHVHFEVRHPDFRTLASEMQFEGDRHAAGDFVTDEEDREILAVTVEATGEGHEPGVVRARFDIILRPR